MFQIEIKDNHNPEAFTASFNRFTKGALRNVGLSHKRLPKEAFNDLSAFIIYYTYP